MTQNASGVGIIFGTRQLFKTNRFGLFDTTTKAAIRENEMQYNIAIEKFQNIKV